MAEDAAPVAAPAATKPQKPDEAAFKVKVGKLEKEHTQVKSQLDAVKAKIELATPGKNPENPTQKRRQELIAQLNEIRKKQGDGKNSRTAAQEQIKRLDEQIKERKKELKTLQETIGFRDEAALDNRIKELDAQVASGKLTLLDEKKTVEQIGKLRRSRKQFPLIQEKQKAVDELDAKIKETKGKSNNPEAKALSEQYNTIQAELDTIKAEQDAAYKELSSLRDERSKLQAQQREKWDELKKCKDDYHTARKAFNNWEREQKQKAWERNKAERERQEKERKLERAQKMLAEASDAAYLDEIRRANSLLHFFDPSFVGEEKAPLQASSGLEAQAERKVDDSGIKGTKIVSKKDLDDDYLPAVKKGKKGKKKSATKTVSSFNCPPSVVEDCAFMNIDPPMSADEVPAVIEKVKAKLDHWKSDQSAQTQRNIEKAKKEIEKIEAEEAKEKEGGKKSGSATPNGDAAENGDKAVDAVVNDVAGASLEDKKDAEAVATA